MTEKNNAHADTTIKEVPQFTHTHTHTHTFKKHLTLVQQVFFYVP